MQTASSQERNIVINTSATIPTLVGAFVSEQAASEIAATIPGALIVTEDEWHMYTEKGIRKNWGLE